jgi:peptidoglycan biosynthesis protein MviN/MurJ (putative lipid II flippase)
VFDGPSLARIGRAVLASLIMLGALAGLAYAWPFPPADRWLQALWLAVSVGGGMAVFFAGAWLLGERLGLGLKKPPRSQEKPHAP